MPPCDDITPWCDEKKKIASELAAHLPPAHEKHKDSAAVKVRGAGTALLKDTTTNKIPERRKAEIMQVLREHYKKEDITPEDIENASKLDIRQHLRETEDADQLVTEEEAIAKYITAQGEEAILQFVIRWRKVFLEGLRPAHMPQHWDVNHDFSLK